MIKQIRLQERWHIGNSEDELLFQYIEDFITGLTLYEHRHIEKKLKQLTDEGCQCCGNMEHFTINYKEHYFEYIECDCCGMRYHDIYLPNEPSLKQIIRVMQKKNEL